MEFSFTSNKCYDDVPHAKDESPFALGLHVPGFFDKIIEVEDCKLQSDISNRILNFTREFFKERKLSIYSTKTHTGYLRFLVIRQSKNINELMVNLITYDYDERLMNEYSTEMKTLFPEVTTLLNSLSTGKAQVAVSEKSKVLYGKGYIIEKLNNGSNEFSFKISPNSFFQTNTKQSEKLYKTMMSFADFDANDTVYDLYCGAGAISLFISDRVKSVTGVELVSDAIENAKENSTLNNVLNVRFVLNDIKDYLKSIKEAIEVEHNKLILDPPRSGLHPDICKMLAGTNFEKILYISCNPVTQARDIKMICENGNYTIEKMQPVDMFPQTYHIENVCSLIPGEK
jgi:23S rRNA (uracil1939-C5)-methyltransferase